MASGRAYEDVLLLAQRELDHAVCGDVAASDDLAFVGDCSVVDAHGAALHVAAGFTVDTNRTAFALSRYRTNGTLDPSFQGGKLTTNFGDLEDVCHAVALQKDGKIVAAGHRDLGTGDLLEY